MTERLRSTTRVRRPPSEPPLSKAEALKIAQRLFFLSGEGHNRAAHPRVRKVRERWREVTDAL